MLKPLRLCDVRVGDFVYDEATDSFHKVVAQTSVLGSGPNPDRLWLAYENNPKILEVDPSQRCVVRRVAVSQEAPVAPIETTPIETTPIETTPIETTPIETTPIETTPIETTPIETTPIEIAVVCQAWMESERGWGIRPDGFSLHLSREDYLAWVEQHFAQQVGPVPDEYSRPSGTPRQLFVDAEIYQQLIDAKQNGALGIHMRFINQSKLAPLP